MITLRNLGIVLLAAVGALSVLDGCSSDPTTASSSGATDVANDSGTGTGSGTGSGTGTGAGGGIGDGGGAGNSDAAMSSDAASSGDGGTLGFMDTCTQPGTPGDCAPGLQCHNFSDHGVHCTHPCTKATAATDCPAPSTGCGGILLCKP
jgi:hypothetical protein